MMETAAQFNSAIASKPGLWKQGRGPIAPDLSLPGKSAHNARAAEVTTHARTILQVFTPDDACLTSGTGLHLDQPSYGAGTRTRPYASALTGA
jgi:hypothetical protein